MKTFACGLVTALGLMAWPIAMPAASRLADAVRVAGQRYVRLTEWAAGRSLQVRWLKRDEVLQVTGRATKLVLTVDSREAKVNGIGVWLLFPLISRNGAVYLSELDARTTLQPILAPPRNSPRAKIRKICLDPGHGGKDPGNQVGSRQEKTYTLLLAREVRQQLVKSGFDASLTRGADEFLELPTRPALARRRSADLFVSLHFNSSENGRDAVRGAETYCLTPVGASSTNARGEGAGAGRSTGNRLNEKNLCLAYHVQKSLVTNLAVEDRGVRRARFAVLRDAPMPAVLVEAGFMSHPEEGKKIFTAAYREQLARAIVQGLMAYKRVVETGGG